MENIDKDRFIFSDVPGGVQMTILPGSKPGLLVVLFPVIWLAGLSMNLYSAMHETHSAQSVFLFFLWLIFWALIGLIGFKILLWQAKGREMITIANGSIIHERKACLFFKRKEYNLNDVTNMRIRPEGFMDSQGVRDNNNMRFIRFADLFAAFNILGNISFEYRGKVIKFMTQINDDEGMYILKTLIQKGVLKEGQYY